MSEVRKVFEAFVNANEVQSIQDAWTGVLKATGVIQGGTGFFGRLREVVEPQQSFRNKRIFEILELAKGARSGFVEAAAVSGTGARRIVVSGAGPVGLRAAVECALLGHLVTVVEKRSTFSRVNILTFWQETMDDMVSLGAKFFYPALLIHGTPLFMGTREIQLCLLKVALLLGVEVRYRTVLSAIAHGENSTEWCVLTSAASSLSKRRSVSTAIKQALSFKPDKTDDYAVTFRCNMMDEPEVDQSFLVHRDSLDGTNSIPLNALLVAEGEWSTTCRKLGVVKTVDRFKQALGLVINMDIDPESDVEKAMQSITLGFAPTKTALRSRLEAAGLDLEGIEYLKGNTHYIVASFSGRNPLISLGVLKHGDAEVLLSENNVDMHKLRALARRIALAVGLPESTRFCAHNPIQLFDFSTRARAFHPMRFINTQLIVSNEPPSNDPDVLPVMPIGDALLEPFWPQGLGSNRGFHGAIDVAFATLYPNPKDMFVERRFAYTMMNSYTWKSNSSLNSFEHWSPDPLDRYHDKCRIAARKELEGKGLQIPARAQNKKSDRGRAPNWF